MEPVRDTLYINVEYYIDELYGPTYVASADDIGLVTDGHTFPELLKNLEEAIAVCSEDTDTVKEFNVIRIHALSSLWNFPKTMPRLRRLSAREVIRILEDLGYSLIRTRGSHYRLVLRKVLSGKRSLVSSLQMYFDHSFIRNNIHRNVL